MQYAREHEREWRERLDAFGTAMEQQRENTLDIMCALTHLQRVILCQLCTALHLHQRAHSASCCYRATLSLLLRWALRRADMSRQFKAMQEKHLAKIGTLEKSTQELHEQLAGKEADISRLHSEHAAVVADKDTLIKDLRHKQEVMAQEFAEMLRETLDKMADCLEVPDVGEEHRAAVSEATPA